jgi:hypothetical protein
VFSQVEVGLLDKQATTLYEIEQKESFPSPCMYNSDGCKGNKKDNKVR